MPHKKTAITVIIVIAALAGSGLLGLLISFLTDPLGTAERINKEQAMVALVVPPVFRYTFNAPGILEEAGNMDESSSPYFWLNSGGRLFLRDGFGETVQGALPLISKWRLAYNISNPRDTDGGAHPQNIFRLITRSRWLNASAEVYFLITRDNVSASPNRNASNGLLLMSRYADSDNLYYAGVRVDGTAVIKKKIGGVYYTMSETPMFVTGTAYDRTGNPNVLPKSRWLGLKCEAINNPDGSVSIRLFLDKERTGKWQLALESIDDGERYGGPAFKEEGYTGIRTDFMDVKFQDYTLAKI